MLLFGTRSAEWWVVGRSQCLVYLQEWRQRINGLRYLLSHFVVAFNTYPQCCVSYFSCKSALFIIIIIMYSPRKDSNRRFHNLSKTLCRTPLDEWSARRKGLYLHRKNTYIHTQKHEDKHPCLSGIRTYDSSNQAAKTYKLDRGATGTGGPFLLPEQNQKPLNSMKLKVPVF
jgi:hypothetical protein